MNKKFVSITFLCVISVISLFYVATRNEPVDNYTIADFVKTKTPENINLPTTINLLNQKKWHKQEKTDYIIVNYWATWCPPCLKELPELNALAKTLSNQPIEILGISMDNEDALVKDFLKKTTLAYPVASFKEVSHYVGAVQSIPATMIFNKENRLVYFNVGFETQKSLLDTLKNLKESRIQNNE